MNIGLLVDNGMCSSLRLTNLGGLDTTNDETDELSYPLFVKFLYLKMKGISGEWTYDAWNWEDFGFMVAYTVAGFQEQAEKNLAEFGFVSTPHTTQRKNQHWDEYDDSFIYGDVALHYMEMNDLVPRLKAEYERLKEEGKINA